MPQSEFAHHTARVNDVLLHYVIRGEGEPIVLLHGWPQTWYEWRKLMPALAAGIRSLLPTCAAWAIPPNLQPGTTNVRSLKISTSWCASLVSSASFWSATTGAAPWLTLTHARIPATFASWRSSM